MVSVSHASLTYFVENGRSESVAETPTAENGAARKPGTRFSWCIIKLLFSLTHVLSLAEHERMETQT